MSLSDAQIERFSRQIVLPEVGGVGQARLLASRAAVVGEDPLREQVALALVAAGVGGIALADAPPALCDALLDAHPEVAITHLTGPLSAVAADIVLVCDATPTRVDEAVASRRPVVAGGRHAQGGWLVLSEPGGICAGCVARLAPREARGPSLEPELAPPAAGVIASLMALTALTRLLDRAPVAARGWLHFDATRPTLSTPCDRPPPTCPTCAAPGPP